MRFTAGKFNEVSTDLAIERINRLCKIGGGIVGITHNKSALDRWQLTFCGQAVLSDEAHKMVGLQSNNSDITTYKEECKSRLKRDEQDTTKLKQKFQLFNPFGRDMKDLVCISTNDVAPTDIKEGLLSARQKGTTLIKEFVDKRLGENRSILFHDPISKTLCIYVC